MTNSEALALLKLEPPKIRGTSQVEVDKKLSEWKEGDLKDAFRSAAHESHPDKHPDDPEAPTRFKAVREAYEQLGDLKVNLKRPEKRCPSGHEREPATAKYCHECGYCFVEEPLVSRLKSRGITERTIEALRSSGELDDLRRMNPLSEDLRQAIELVFHRERLGLVGSRGWR